MLQIYIVLVLRNYILNNNHNCISIDDKDTSCYIYFTVINP